MTMPQIGDYIETPRFLNVRIEAIFTKVEDANTLGFTQPTHFKGDFKILGRNLGNNLMDFAALVPCPADPYER